MIFICSSVEDSLVTMNNSQELYKENTLSSLKRAIQLTDGIEYDVRSTIDGELIIHHDRTLSVSENLKSELPNFVEKNTLSDLKELGFSSFRDVINDPTIIENLVENSKLMNIELKLPHPSSGVGSGWFNTKKNISHISSLLSKCGQILTDAEIPKNSVIFYGFFKHMNYAAKKIKFNWNVSSLFPNQLRFGSRWLNRIYASKEFSLRSLRSMIKLQKIRKSPILPCGLEYFISPYNRMRLDKKYGLKSKSLENLLTLREGFPIYIWPGLIEYEYRLYNAGISILTDDLDEEQVSLPEGIPRWTRPSTQPLDEEWRKKFTDANIENHKDIIKEATQNVSSWSELGDAERNIFVKYWSKKWNWGKNIEFSEKHLPWESVRIIGHRGCGETSRPIFN